VVELVQPVIDKEAQTEVIVYSELRQLPLVVEVEEVRGVRFAMGQMGAPEGAAPSRAARGRKEGMAAAGMTIKPVAAAAEAEHQVKTEGLRPTVLVETVETERPTRGVTSAQRAQLMQEEEEEEEEELLVRVERAGAGRGR